MRTISKDELTEILRKHKMWLSGEAGGIRADLSRANLRGADLCGADLCEAVLCEADLRGADLRGADLYKAVLYKAVLRGAKNLNFPIACPEKGTFTAFKKAGEYIIELEIPSDALRSSSTTRKCRCSKAKVVSITNLDGTHSDIKSVASCHDSKFIYNLGETVEVPNFDTNRWNECAPGIHFFITRQEAIDYAL